MYNEEIKKRFIRDTTDSISFAKICVSVFDYFEKYEKEWQADLCTKNETELSPVVNNMFGLRIKNRFTRIKILRDYVDWCIKHNIDGACNGMLKIETIGVDKVIKQTVSNPLQLQKYLDDVFGSNSLETTDVVLRCCCWLAFMGFSEEDILNIKNEHVHLEDMEIRYNNIEAPIYRESLKTFKQCLSLEEFLYDHPNFKKKSYKKRVEGDILIRSVVEPNKYLIRTTLSKKTKAALDIGATAKQLSIYRIWISGIFYRAYEQELAGIKPTFEREAYNFTKGKYYKLDKCGNKQEAKTRRVAKEYRDDYERWKLAFSI